MKRRHAKAGILVVLQAVQKAEVIAVVISKVVGQNPTNVVPTEIGKIKRCTINQIEFLLSRRVHGIRLNR